jgi:threonyl-tRNA synthetase
MLFWVLFLCFYFKFERRALKMKVIRKDGSIVERKFEEVEGKEAFWHTSAHVLAQAIKRLYPTTKCGIGPSIEHGFYYDFDFDFNFTEEHLQKVEDMMKSIIEESLVLQQFILTRDEATHYLKERKEPYKLELLKELPCKVEISFFEQGEFADLCSGPHLRNVSYIKAIKLTQIAGAYWRGKEDNKMLTRIYGISFPRRCDLENYLNQLEEARLRDHRKLGKELELFTFVEEGPGFPFFLPKGMVVKNLLLDYWRKLHEREGYVEISTPMILNRNLWETSGHWEHYHENMYQTIIDDVEYAIKPMNCPGGMLVYQSKPRSYKELPLRLGELGLVHRHEKSGQLHGLMRVRCFTQDDAHIFMTEGQIKDEIKGVVRLIDEVYKKFGFSYHVELSTRPENSIGSQEDWELATSALKMALDEMKLSYLINEGDGAFYGPKIDFHLEDSIGRTWQCGSIQLDFQLPLRFGVKYIGADGEAHRPIMIHRVIFGSIERFFGILIEHYAGKFPTWLAPVQVKVLTVSEQFDDYAHMILEELKQQGIRVNLDNRSEKLGYKIREARLDKVPYVLIIGQKEMVSEQVSVWSREEGDLGEYLIEDFMNLIKNEILF